MQRLPLQRIRVLKLINQQMLDLCIEALLHPARERIVTQQMQGRSLQIPHIHPAALALHIRKTSVECTTQLRHTLLMLPSGMLLLRFLHACAQLLRGADELDPFHLVGKFARLILLREQANGHSIPLFFLQGFEQLYALGGIGFLRSSGEMLGGLQQSCFFLSEFLQGLIEVGECREDMRERPNAFGHHARLISQRKLHTLGQRIFQRRLHTPAPHFSHRFTIHVVQRVVA